MCYQIIITRDLSTCWKQLLQNFLWNCTVPATLWQSYSYSSMVNFYHALAFVLRSPPENRSCKTDKKAGEQLKPETNKYSIVKRKTWIGVREMVTPKHSTYGENVLLRKETCKRISNDMWSRKNASDPANYSSTLRFFNNVCLFDKCYNYY